MPLVLLFLMFVMLMLLIQIGIFSLVLDKLGLSPESAGLLLLCTLFGSIINIPLFKISSDFHELHDKMSVPRLFLNPILTIPHKTIIAINVGGALIPLGFSLYLISHSELSQWQIIPAIAVVSTVSYLFSRPIKGLGIGMPIFIAPLTAALCALLLAPENSPPLAYICGTLGVIIGADILRLNNIRNMGVPVAAIGGAGTFDGIFFTGIIAVLLT